VKNLLVANEQDERRLRIESNRADSQDIVITSAVARAAPFRAARGDILTFCSQVQHPEDLEGVRTERQSRSSSTCVKSRCGVYLTTMASTSDRSRSTVDDADGVLSRSQAAYLGHHLLGLARTGSG
jgi:hypothetical protein